MGARSMKHSAGKKVGTLTFHMAHNHGAMLQAYALERAINRLGQPCEVIDYRFRYIDNWSGTRTWHEQIQQRGLLKGTAVHLLWWKKGVYKNMSPSRMKFDSFMRKDLNLSKKTYFTPDDLRKSRYQTVVFGSDQIWNEQLTGGFAPEYMGKGFKETGCRLIAYAASCGTSGFEASHKDSIYPLLKHFYAIGVRERSLAEFLRTEYGLKTETVVDPVFLLQASDWSNMADEAEIHIDEPYLVLYAFQTGNEIYDLARRIAKERNLKLVAICYKKREGMEDILQLTDCGPKDMVHLIRDAEFVCTTSFHGTAFSVIFEKNFYCIGHPLYSQRNFDLLETVGMGDRMVASDAEVSVVTDCIYTEARVKLQREIEKSKEFLTASIKGVSYAD